MADLRARYEALKDRLTSLNVKVGVCESDQKKAEADIAASTEEVKTAMAHFQFPWDESIGDVANFEAFKKYLDGYGETLLTGLETHTLDLDKLIGDFNAISG